MRSSYAVVIAASLLAGSAFAQAEKAPAAPHTDTHAVPAAKDGPSNPAVRTGEGNTATAPVAGANSFTEGEAKSRIEARGFANVSELKKDEQGIWRGKAQREGKSVDVALDFQGNVFARDAS